MPVEKSVYGGGTKKPGFSKKPGFWGRHSWPAGASVLRESGGPGWGVRLTRTALIGVGIGLWFFTQWLIGARPPLGDETNAAGVLLSQHDGLLALTEPLNLTLHEHPAMADALLITSSALIDLLGIFLLGAAVFGHSIRPFLGLLILLTLRQICQALCALPAPDGIIWRSPGFPTLLVTYGVANDFFFSGHTGIAVLGATELSRLKSRGPAALGVAVVLFEAAAVIVLRAHYTLDVFTGVVTALFAAGAASRIAPGCDRWIEKWATAWRPRRMSESQSQKP